MYYKNWFKKVIYVLIILFSFIILFNYFVDSANVFRDPIYLKSAAQEITKGKMIQGLVNHDDKKLQELIIQNSNKKRNTIALGSSRTMFLRKTYVNDNSFFNHSVSSALLEDYISIIGIYKSQKNYIPKNIIIGIDPWIFNVHNQSTRKSLRKYYSNMYTEISGNKYQDNNDIYSKYLELINYDYTISNYKNLKKYKKYFSLTNTKDIDAFILDNDGSVYYPYSQRYPSVDEVKKKAIIMGTTNVYKFNYFNKIGNIEIFKNFINYLKRKKVNITFFLPSYSPITYDLLIKNPKYDMILSIEDFLREYAKQENIQILGSYNPHINKFLMKDFYDGIHPQENVVKEIFRSYNKGQL